MRTPIYKKLLLGFLGVIALMIAANAYVLWQLNDVTATTSLTLRSDVRSIDLARQLQTILFEEERHAQKHLISGDSTYYTLYLDQSNLFTQYVDSMLEASPGSTEIDLINGIRQKHAWANEEMELEVGSGSKLPDRDLARRDRIRSDSLEAIHERLNELIRSNEASVGKSVSNISDTMVRSTNVAWLITVGALLVALAVALFITRTIVRPIRMLIKGTENIARGVFDPIEVHSHDELAWLADAVNDMSNKLKQINDLKTEMMHHISHELRTPLQTMLSAQYLLLDSKRGPLNAEQIRLLKSIKGGIRKLTEFSNQFLDIQKIEHGSMEYNFVRSNFVDMIAPVVEDAQIVAAEKEVAVLFTYEENLPEIFADSEKISQVFSNLLSNAIKYTDSGGTITIAVSNHKKVIAATVRDTGTGIPKEDLPRIFTKFYQAKNAKKGTGIGLALVKALVEGHKGRVYVESELGKGTTFTMELPIAPQEEKRQSAVPLAVTEGAS